MSACSTKHTKYQPTIAEWVCPKCGTDNSDGQFYIYEPASEEAADCDKLHVEDFIKCENCGYEVFGDALAKQIKEKKNMVPCPHCRGRGFVKGDTNA